MVEYKEIESIVKVIQKLLESMSSKNYYGNGVGAIADCIKELILCGADSNADDGWVLRHAVQSGNIDVVKAILGGVVDVNINGGDGNSFAKFI